MRPISRVLALAVLTSGCGDDVASTDSAGATGTTSDAASSTGAPLPTSSATDSATSAEGSASDSASTSTSGEPTTTTGLSNTASSGESTTSGDETGSTSTGEPGSTSTGEPLMCPDVAPPAHDGPGDPSCATVVQVGMFTPQVEWKKPTWAANPSSKDIGMAPVVVSLTDDNADGKIDEQDVADIVVVTFSPAVLRAVSGADGAEIFSVTPPGLEFQSGVAAGDIDGDGVAEILANCTESVCAFDHDGAMKWKSMTFTSEDVGDYSYSPPAISDMDGDGAPEIVFGRVILNNDGTLRGKGMYGRGGSIGLEAMSFAVDVDADGTQEVVVGNALYTPDGAAIWQNGKTDGFPAVADFDGDSVPEIVVVSDGHLRLQTSTDGAVLWDVVTSWRGGPPTVADFDGDGEPEIGVAQANYYAVYNGDGTTLWSKPTVDGSSAVTGSTVYDFEGDGVSDVVYSDEQQLWVFSGVDGAVKLQFKEHSSGTWFEYPVIADVDDDGQVEIVYVSQGVYSGITVIGDADKSWRPGRGVWNQYNYHITNSIRLS